MHFLFISAAFNCIRSEYSVYLDSKNYKYRAVDITATIKGPKSCLTEICKILDNKSIIYEV